MSRKKKEPEGKAEAPAKGEPAKDEALTEEELAEVSGGETALGWMSITAKTSGGISVAYPDVCQTPTSPGPVPIPYPNTTSIGDTDSATRKTKVDE
jgi:bacteriocin-like protein